MADQICIVTKTGVICYANKSPKSGNTQYRVSYHLNGGSRRVLPDGGGKYRAQKLLRTRFDKLIELRSRAGKLMKRKDQVAKDVQSLGIENWKLVRHTP